MCLTGTWMQVMKLFYWTLVLQIGIMAMNPATDYRAANAHNRVPRGGTPGEAPTFEPKVQNIDSKESSLDMTSQWSICTRDGTPVMLEKYTYLIINAAKIKSDYGKYLHLVTIERAWYWDKEFTTNATPAIKVLLSQRLEKLGFGIIPMVEEISKRKLYWIVSLKSNL